MATASASEARRERMVKVQLSRLGVDDDRVIAAFRSVPREAFLPRFKRPLAYLPIPLDIGYGQTISQPLAVARMLQLARIGPEDRVLDVGAGSGYQTALLARVCSYVYGLEIIPALAERANKALRDVGIQNAMIHVANGHDGLPAHAPYDAILVAAVAPEVPAALLGQLKDGGRLIMPVGPHLSRREMTWSVLLKRPSPQRLVRITRRGESFDREELGQVYFVPFVQNYRA
ncbi:MAG TPA: protein-L-isoaspartate(D-aspartate) O-methyltransferase [Polyangiales bacterium]|nr:protein-L-isoaspartate(D-aspartate) O-methyltransferase [Polyangiales bacterium]